MPETDRLRSIYVASTIPRQNRFEKLTSSLRQSLGRAATILETDKTHMTFLASRGVRSTLESYGYNLELEDDFVAGMQAYLDKRGYAQRINARIDQDQPLKWMAKRSNSRILGLNFEKDQQMIDRRGDIEQFLIGQLGIIPPIVDFNPHVTVGMVSKAAISWHMRSNPESIMPAASTFPSTITLNGLQVYYDAVHAEQREVPFRFYESPVSAMIPEPAVA